MACRIIGKTKEGKPLAELTYKGVSSLMAQFVGQPSKYVQELALITGGPSHLQKAVGIYAEGRNVIYDSACQMDAENISNKHWMNKTSNKIAENLARFLADEVRLGFTHHDVGGGNIIISPEGHEPKIRLIDFGECAVSPLEDDFINKFIDGIRSEYRNIKSYILLEFGNECIRGNRKNEYADKELLDYFDREFERSISRFNGESIG